MPGYIPYNKKNCDSIINLEQSTEILILQMIKQLQAISLQIVCQIKKKKI